MTFEGAARVILVANRKGGVGKSTTVAAISQSIASGGRGGGRKVLVIDGDPQGTVTQADLGAHGDGGASLAMTFQYGMPLTPVRGVRPNLDVLAGGPKLSMVGAATEVMRQNGINMTENFRRSLEELCAQQGYEFVVIDSAPGEVPLLDTFLGIANYLIIPTKSDEGSLKAVGLLAEQFWQARAAGALIKLLGVVLFGVDPKAPRRNQDIIEQIGEMLEGSGVEPFTAYIRHNEGAAVDMRNLGVTPAELVAIAKTARKERLTQLRNGEKPGRTLWSSNPIGLAGDYRELVYDLISRIAHYEADHSDDVAMVGA